MHGAIKFGGRRTNDHILPPMHLSLNTTMHKRGDMIMLSIDRLCIYKTSLDGWMDGSIYL